MVMHKQSPALDRRAILAIAARGSLNQYGEFEQRRDVTEHAIWVCLKDSMIGIEAQLDGISQEADVELIARYRADVF